MEENELHCYVSDKIDYTGVKVLSCAPILGYLNTLTEKNITVEIAIYITPDSIIIDTEKEDITFFSLIVGENNDFISDDLNGFKGRINLFNKDNDNIINLLSQKKRNEFHLAAKGSVSISFVLNSNGFKEKYEDYIEKIEDNLYLTWKIGAFADEFENKIGEKYLYSGANGTGIFSTTHTPINMAFHVTKDYFGLIIRNIDYSTPYISEPEVTLSITDKNNKKYSIHGLVGNKSNIFLFYNKSYKDLINIMSIGGAIQIKLKSDSFTASLDINDNMNFKETYEILYK
jgi:hypothetical protein